jgi:MFS superfamily sulfate permease-like transporter
MNELLAIYWPSFHDFAPGQLVGIAIGSIIGGWITTMMLTAGRGFGKKEKRIWVWL